MAEKGRERELKEGTDERSICKMKAHESEIKNNLIMAQARATACQSNSLPHFISQAHSTYLAPQVLNSI